MAVVLWLNADAVPLIVEALAQQDGQPLVITHSRWTAEHTQQIRAEVNQAVATGRLGAGDIVVFTSGSTGTPRGIIRSRTSWAASVGPLREILKLDADDHVMVPGSPSGTMNLYACYHADQCGAAFSTTINAHIQQAATIVHLVPTSVAPWLDLVSRGTLPRLRCIVTAGDALPPHIFDQAEGMGLEIVDYYGAAELSFVGWRTSAGAFTDFPGATTRVKDGKIWVTSPFVATAPLSDDAAITDPWQHDGRWSTVGDLATSQADGWLLHGRGTSAVNIGGYTVVVEPVESALTGLDGVSAAALGCLPHARLGQQLVCLLVGSISDDELNQMMHNWDPPARPRRFLRVESLPYTSAGKLDRIAVQHLIDNHFQPASVRVR